jgi:hypothetical protein
MLAMGCPGATIHPAIPASGTPAASAVGVPVVRVDAAPAASAGAALEDAAPAASAGAAPGDAAPAASAGAAPGDAAPAASAGAAPGDAGPPARADATRAVQGASVLATQEVGAPREAGVPAAGVPEAATAFPAGPTGAPVGAGPDPARREPTALLWKHCSRICSV